MKIVIPIIALSALIASGVSAWSGSPSTGKLQIKMTIDKECKVNPGGDAILDFGAIGIVDGNSNIDVNSIINIQCTKGVSYSIALGRGNYSYEGTSYFKRRLKLNPEDYFGVPYELYLDSARTKIWGDGRMFDLAAFISTDGSVQSIPVYGRVNTYAIDRLPLLPGTYTDTVTVTVQF